MKDGNMEHAPMMEAGLGARARLSLRRFPGCLSSARWLAAAHYHCRQGVEPDKQRTSDQTSKQLEASNKRKVRKQARTTERV